MNGVLVDLLAASRKRPILGLPEAAVAADRPSLRAALQGRDELSVLAEFKRSSPSNAAIALEADLATQVRAYESAGAAALSVLTEPTRFGGSLADLRGAVAATALPVLRKDFLVRPAQVQEAAAHGASAVLLIVRCLPDGLLGEMVDACADIGLETLIECHDEADLERALPFDDAILGINNRDLDSLVVDRGVFLRLAEQVPNDRILVAESGYTDPQQLRELHGLADAVLIGTALMQSETAASFVARRVS